MQYSVILMETQNPGTIGSIARAMKNFGLKDLILVNPCEITAITRARAMHAWDVVQNAKIVDSFEEAIQPFDELIATTANTSTDKNTTRAYLTPRELAASVGTGNYAFVFGRESSGLNNKELRRCDTVVHIEAGKYSVLNISHAAAIVFYEMFSSKSSTKRKSDSREKRTLISLFSELAEKSELRNSENAIKMFRNVISRAFISGREANGIAGVFSALRK